MGTLKALACIKCFGFIWIALLLAHKGISSPIAGAIALIAVVELATFVIAVIFSEQGKEETFVTLEEDAAMHGLVRA